MGFRSRLPHQPLVVEVIPPARGAAPARVEQSLSLVEAILQRCRADAVNVPEIIGSGFQSMDPLDFGLLVHERFGVDVVVNKVVVHTPAAELRAWLRRVVDSPLASAILVGGERGGIYYPGPRVTGANRLAREVAEEGGRRDFAVGNVTLPTRPHEAARMLEKTAAGCDYFTSQIVYEFPSANAHLQAYDDLCALESVPPRPVLYAFSPASSETDVRFLRYLGVHVPPDVERALLASGDASVHIIEDIWRVLLAAARQRTVRVPLGIIVETVSRHHADAIGPLAERLRREFERPAVAPPA